MRKMKEIQKLPEVQITDLGNGLIHWHRTSEAEQILYQLFKQGKINRNESNI